MRKLILLVDDKETIAKVASIYLGKDYDIQELLQKLDELSQLDVNIKTGKIDRFRGLELFLIRIGGQ